MKNRVCLLFLLGFMFLSAGCTPAQPTGILTYELPSSVPATQNATHTMQPVNPVTQTAVSTSIATPIVTQTEIPKTATIPPAPTKKPIPTIGPEDWKGLYIVPPISDTVVQIYQRGLAMGNNPRAFSKIGDCGSTPAWFLGDFDRGPDFYRLGPYTDLAEVIQEFQGSFGRTSLAARSGFNVSSLLVSLWVDTNYCQVNETPLACEYRVHKPVFAFIMLGSNDVWHPQAFEPNMRKLIEFSIEHGVVPILSTKADNQEGDGAINATIAQLAQEYDIPLWNFWLAVQHLPDKGLDEDKVHLTWARNYFDDPVAMSKAWPIRNLTALQVLNAIWRKVTGQSQ